MIHAPRKMFCQASSYEKKKNKHFKPTSIIYFIIANDGLL
jgi:hypothetical protein